MADPKIKYDIEANVKGDVEVGQLAGKLEALANTLDGDLKTNANAAAAALRQLGDKQAAITRFIELKQGAQDAAAKLSEAQAAAQKMGQTLAASEAPTRAQTGQMQKLGDAVRAAKADVLQQTAAVQDARGALQQYGIGTQNLSESQKNLKAAIGAAKLEINALIPAYTKAGEQAVASGKASVASIKGVTEEIKKAEQGGSAMGAAFSKLGPIMAAAFSGRQFIDAIVQAEAMQRGLKAVTGSTAGAASEMEYLRNTSNRLGLELQSTSLAYLQLTAATKGTAIEGQKTKELFEAISVAGTTLGKSGEEIGRMLNAVSQMASKGTVSMEELRGQLGEALPGALAAAAKGAGITTQELIQMVSTGDVLAKDLLPALTKGLNDLYGTAPPEGIISNWNRFNNAVTSASVSIGKGGAAGGLTDAAGGAAVAVTGLFQAADVASGGISDLAMAVRLASLDEFHFSERVTESHIEIAKVMKAAGFAVPAIKELGTASVATGDATQDAFRKSEIAARNAGEGIEDLALKQQTAFTKTAIDAVRHLEQSKAAAAAADAEAQAVTLLANAFGSETDRINANIFASNLLHEAQDKLAKARRADLDINEQRLVQLKKETEGLKEIPPELAKNIKDLTATILVKKEESRASEESAKSHGIAAAAARTAAEAYKDNSTRLGQLKAAYDDTTRAVEVLRAKQLQGLATAEQVDSAVLKQSQAQKLYADALRDTVTAAEIHEKVISRNAVTRAKESDLNIEAARTTLELAKARGDESAATAAQTRLTNEEAEARRQAVKAVHDEAEAMRATATALENEAKATGSLTTEKKEQLAAIRESAAQKDLDARKSEILADREYQLARATANSAEAFVAALEKKVSAQEKLNAVIERAIALEDKRLNRDKEGFSIDPKTGQRVNMQVDTQRSIFENAKSQGLSEAQSLQITNQFITQAGEKIGWNDGGRLGAMQGENWGTALQKAIDGLVLKNANASANAISAGNTYTTNVTIEGSTRRINTADAASSAALQDILSELAAARSTSSR